MRQKVNLRPACDCKCHWSDDHCVLCNNDYADYCLAFVDSMYDYLEDDDPKSWNKYTNFG